MNDIANRIRELRDLLELSRKEVEIRSNGTIKASALSSFENAQSQISITYLKQLVAFYRQQGVDVGFDWLITGNGPAPTETSTLESNLAVIKEISFFKKMNANSVIYTSPKNILALNIEQGDVIGAVIAKKRIQKTKLCLIRLKNGEYILGLALDKSENIIIFDPDQVAIDSLPLEMVDNIYEIIWIRKFL
jgi:transcriptional regulator with XRE-family HTH domain